MFENFEDVSELKQLFRVLAVLRAGEITAGRRSC